MVEGNVLPFRDPPRENSYRHEVARMIARVKLQYSLTDYEIAERVGCCKKTIHHASNRANNLSPVTLLRFGYEFGMDVLEDVLALAARDYAQSEPTIEDRWAIIEQQQQAIRRMEA